jgi:hypothetical protein
VRTGRRIVLAGIAVAAVGWVGFARLAPTLSLPGCPFLTATSLDCPGCGSTRCLAALANGDLFAAFDHNLLVPFFALILFAVWVKAVAREVNPRYAASNVDRTSAVSVRSTLISSYQSVAVGVLFALFTVARNLPVDAFSWMASGIDF